MTEIEKPIAGSFYFHRNATSLFDMHVCTYIYLDLLLNLIDFSFSSSRSSAAELNNKSRSNSQQRPSAQSIQVLKHEAELLEEQIETLEDHFTADQLNQLRVKHKALKEQSDQIVENLRQGGKQALEGRIISIFIFFCC
jgi:hypothetical protein